MKDLLPIGSVVLLKDGNKRIMIYGRMQKQIGVDEEILYDYVGCLYPEGNLSADSSILFNHDQIDMIFFIGFQDLEEFRFKEKLLQIYKDE